MQVIDKVIRKKDGRVFAFGYDDKTGEVIIFDENNILVEQDKRENLKSKYDFSDEIKEQK